EDAEEGGDHAALEVGQQVLAAIAAMAEPAAVGVGLVAVAQPVARRLQGNAGGARALDEGSTADLAAVDAAAAAHEERAETGDGVAAADLRNIFPDAAVEVALPLLHQLADYQVHGHLGDRLDAVRLVGAEIGGVALEEDVAAADHRHAREPRQRRDGAHGFQGRDAQVHALLQHHDAGGAEALAVAGQRMEVVEAVAA